MQVAGVAKTSPLCQLHNKKGRTISILGPRVQRGATGAPSLRRVGGGGGIQKHSSRTLLPGCPLSLDTAGMRPCGTWLLSPGISSKPIRRQESNCQIKWVSRGLPLPSRPACGRDGTAFPSLLPSFLPAISAARGALSF